LKFPIILLLVSIVLITAINIELANSNTNNLKSILTVTKKVCVPTPDRSKIINNGTNSDLPPTLPANWGLFTPPVAPTEKPRLISKIIDLAPDLADKDKSWIYVMHCDGSIELIKTRPTEDLQNTLPLLPDDFILDAEPPTAIMVPPPQFSITTVIPSQTRISINGAYPPPPTSTPTPHSTEYP
jgi:hypothetical protein